MGLAVGDYDRDGRLDLAEDAFRRRRPRALPQPRPGPVRGRRRSPPASASQNRYVEWGAGLPDLDNDGLADLVYVTGNVYPGDRAPPRPVPAPRPARRLPQPRRAALRETSARERARRRRRRTRAAGAAFGDFDNDGDVDVLVMNMNEPPSLLRNDYAGDRRLDSRAARRARASNRAGLGATVIVTAGGPPAGAGRRSASRATTRTTTCACTSGWVARRTSTRLKCDGRTGPCSVSRMSSRGGR